MPTRARRRYAGAVRAAAYRALVVVSLFHAASAVGGGIGMVVADGLSMPKSLLADSPFSTYLLPGLILAVVVGGTQTMASVRLLRHDRSAFLWSAVAGFGMVIWIIAEIGFLHVLSWSQMIYVVSGLLQLVLVFSLLGIVGWLPRESMVPRAPARRRASPPGSGSAVTLEPGAPAGTSGTS
jgi:hypothetical protein